MGRLVVAAALAIAVPGTAAAEIIESVFQVNYTHEGAEHVLNNSAVPLLPGNACYTWYLRLNQAGEQVQVVERMTLPEAIDWGTTGQSPDDMTQIEEGGTVAVTTFDIAPDPDGWFSHGWCVADGDPTGPHVIEVSVDGEKQATFPFQVIPVADYPFPVAATYPDRAARSVNDSW